MMETTQVGDYTFYLGETLDVLAQLPEARVQLLIADPPYYRVKAERWDRQWSSQEAYLSWLRACAKAWRRVLAPNGSLYCFAAPDMAAWVEVTLSEVFHVLTRIQWLKEAGWHQKADPAALRTFLSPREEIIFAQQQCESADYDNFNDEARGQAFTSIRAYLDEERRRAGMSFEDVRQMVGCAAGSGLPSHWFTRSQWMLPTHAQYLKLQRGFNAKHGDYAYLRRDYEELRRDYEELRRDYEELRRDYEELRRPFMLGPSGPATDVWNFEPVLPAVDKHPCEKPLPLLRHMITVSSRPGDLVLDPMAGSGSTAEAAKQCGRRCLTIEQEPRWYRQSIARVQQEQFWTW